MADLKLRIDGGMADRGCLREGVWKKKEVRNW